MCQFYFAEKKNLNMSMQKIDNQAGLACSSESHLHLSLQRKPDKTQPLYETLTVFKDHSVPFQSCLKWQRYTKITSDQV